MCAARDAPRSRRRESYYWAAVLATFALGTATGDLTAISLHLGFFDSAVLFAGLIAIPAVAWWRGWMNPILAFWAAYLITRPLGASFADWFGKPHASTGLGLGDGTVSVLALVVFIALVAYAAITRRDVQGAAAAHWQPHLPHPHLAESASRRAPQAQPATD